MDVLGEIEKHAERTGHSLTGLFKAAGLAYSNWGRWKRGETSPTMRNLNKLLDVKRKPAKARA